jgi:rubrerythrin
MSALLSREYCLSHPWEIGRLYGWNVLLGTLVSKGSVLERVAKSFASRRDKMPGPLGKSYQIAQLLELRAAKIYRSMAERFSDVQPARLLFEDFEAEEMEHARLMEICLYTVCVTPEVHYVPSVMDPDIRKVLQAMREVQQRIPEMTLDEALETSEALERSEVNVIFDKLLKQVVQPEVGLLKEALRAAENHEISVPRRIAALREQLAE